MLIVRDFDLNSTQGYANSLKEVLKQEMLNQEITFRKQVHELHRLYRIQKTLMEDSGRKELDGYNLWKVSRQSTLGPFPNSMLHSPLAKERTFSGNPVVGSTQFVSKDFLEENHSEYSRLQQRHFDLQLPADLHNHDCEGFLEKGNGWDLRESIKLKHWFHDNDVSSREEVNLTLNIGGDTRKKCSRKRTWYEKFTHSSSHHVIDLDIVSDDDDKSVCTVSCAASITENKHDLQVPVQSNQVSGNNVKKDSSFGLTMSYSVVDINEACDNQNSFNRGFKERHADNAHNDIFTKGKLFISHEAIGLDLNRVQLDDSSCLNDPVLASLSTTGSTSAFDGLMGKFDQGICPTTTSWRKPNGNCFNEPSTFLQQDDVANPTLMDLDNNCSSKIWVSGATFKGFSGSEDFPVDLESMSRPESDIGEDFDNDNKSSASGNIVLLSKFLKGKHTDVTTADVIETSDNDKLVSYPCRNGNRVEDGNDNKSPTSGKSDCIADDSSGAKTMHSGTDLVASNTFHFNQFRKSQSSQVAETQSNEQDLSSSNSCELKHPCGNKHKEESAGGDVLIQEAAKSLIHFSLGSSTSNQDCFTRGGSNEIENEERDRPQHSLDSYESMVLKITESNVDDCCVTSKSFEVIELDKKDSGIKLRRGRRLKDFQRDVLPSMASLSRHEIREDVTIMETVIRSREYKRMRSKMAGGRNWFTPVKSKRSRLNYVGRRYYS